MHKNTNVKTILIHSLICYVIYWPVLQIRKINSFSILNSARLLIIYSPPSLAQFFLQWHFFPIFFRLFCSWSTLLPTSAPLFCSFSCSFLVLTAEVCLNSLVISGSGQEQMCFFFQNFQFAFFPLHSLKEKFESFWPKKLSHWRN